ncbi:MAG: CCA tRNA nucleotidyltransferase [Hyphomicrobiales bacterium]|nr:CCA tRNA nucleotidyltransferase [Hyphomicrobiales bacterium]
MSEKLALSPEFSGWLNLPGLQNLFDILEKDGEETRVNGGAVRNSILGETIGDVDLSTTLTPDKVLQRLESASIKAIATGLSHGTITAIIDKHPYEITTLRSDIETDGRRAVVEFGRSWMEDAGRRDLTMNALYCDRYGNIFDPLDGYQDLLSRKVRFIGEASQRIEEDYLRILRFFRFFARYGEGRPDGEGLKACARLKEGISSLSVERVWMELKKILGVSDPSRALLWMRTTGVLTQTLPESEKWGIDFVGDLISAEQDLGWSVEMMARLQIMLPPNPEKMEELAVRLKFSRLEKNRLLEWAKAELPNSAISKVELEQILYRDGRQAIHDRIRNEIVRQRHIARDNDEALIKAEKFANLLDLTLNWQRPVFPLKGRDLRKAGVDGGPQMGEELKRLEQEWVGSGFLMSRKELLAGLRV